MAGFRLEEKEAALTQHVAVSPNASRGNFKTAFWSLTCPIPPPLSILWQWRCCWYLLRLVWSQSDRPYAPTSRLSMKEHWDPAWMRRLLRWVRPGPPEVSEWVRGNWTRPDLASQFKFWAVLIPNFRHLISNSKFPNWISPKFQIPLGTWQFGAWWRFQRIQKFFIEIDQQNCEICWKSKN